MSAVFTGNGLGLFNTSLSQLGLVLGGGSGVGQGRDAHYVNVATGNLVWQASDEHLTFRGLAIGLTRTYNSLGQIADTGADGWVTGFERKVALQSGTFNASGSVMRRMTGDGSYQDFTWVSANTYEATDGDGAHDTLTWTGSSWRYTEGSTRREEGYADHADGTAQGRLTYLRDGRSDGTTPVTWQVVYDASQRIAELRADDGTGTGDALLFAYDGNGRLSSVSTREAGTVRLQVGYGYDGQGRLTSVLTDLTPGNTGDNTWDATTAANNDGRLFRTEYTYVGTSLQLASVRQSDGTVVSYTYDADGRLKTVTRGDTNTNDADGVGETTTYTYGSGSTTVTDSLGRAWVYAYDGNGQLTSLTAPAVGGQSAITTYQYDTAGNVTQVKTMTGATVLSLVDYAYDGTGNVTWEWDGLGNAISRTWSATNQLLSLTRYTGVDPDRAGAQLPSGGMTTRYIYDAQDRVRFVVDALGQVSEFTYATSGNGIGQQASLRQYLGAGYAGTYDLASLQAWATTTQKAISQLSELSYDAWGRLSQRTDYAVVDASGAGVLDAGTGITRYTYDAQGTLRQQVTVRGAGRTVGGTAQAGSEQVDYIYDGMGRLLSATRRQVGVGDSDATTIQTSYAYLDSGHQVAVTDDAGQVTVQTRDAAGRLISASAQGVVDGSTQTRTQLNYYDATGQLRASEDAGGGRTYYFYDARGRLEATVDATGAVSRLTYDGADRVVSTRQYASRVTTSGWLVDGKVVPTTVTTTDNNALDRVTGRTYDAAGRLLAETDGLASSAERTITTYTYDAAGRVLQARTTDSVGTAGTARAVRYFYDEAGRTIGQLDAAGYLTERQYDRAGRLLVQTRYATVSPSAHWASGTLAQLRPSANAAQDQTTRYYYDGRGQQVGVLDAQGYLTEWVYDEAGHARAERRYATAPTWAEGDTLASLRSRAGTYREQRMDYNALGQLATQTNAEGTVTRYTYDEAGRLVKTEAAQGTSEVREGHLRYNVFGELIGELGGESAPQVLPGMTEAQLDAVYAQYGVRHGYDVLGRRIESIDAAGNRTWYFYDAAGRNTFTVRGVADGSGVANAQGEVTETRYTAFGDVSDQIAYTGRITLAVPGSRDSVQAAVSTLAYSSSTDTRRQFTYTARGQVATTIDAVGGQRRYTYDAFGQLQQQVKAYGTAAAVTLQYEYDARGLQTRVVEGVGTAVQRDRTQAYDAFGRVTSTTDARGAVRTLTYDRLGRQLTATQVVQGRAETTTTAYDAYGRLLSVTDGEEQVTTYAHDDAARSVTMTSPEGVVVTTVHDRHGQTVRVTDAAGRTEYTYDRNGALTRTERKAGDGTVVTSETREYDTARGLLTAVIDGSGRRVEYQYDAAGRVLRRIQDPAGLALMTTYTYDGQGRQLDVTDPSGRVVGYKYDREGRLTEVAQDPAGLDLRTQYTYDVLGRQVSVIEGAGTPAARTTQYTYDVLGRRTSEVVDPGTGKLDLTTSYAYDNNDNVIRRTDANGQVTRYYYDEANRQVYTVDPLGAMTRQWYDRVGQVVAVRAYAQATTASTLTDATTLAQLEARLTNDASDQGQYRVYDKDGRVRFELDLGGGLTEYRYDAAGRLVGTRAYATAYSPGSLEAGLRAGTVDPSQIVPTAVEAGDRRLYYVLDAAGQTQLTVDAAGNVRQLQYDAAGRVVGSVAYAQAAALTTALRNQLQAGTATVDGVMATVAADPASDRTDYRIHDAAGRLRYTLQAATASTLTVREQRYDAASQVVAEVAYAVTIGTGTAKTVTAVAAAVTAAGGDEDTQQRVTTFVRDAAGRLRFQMDDAGAVVEWRYDSLGQVVQSRQYALAISMATARTEVAMAAAVAGQTGSSVRVTQTAYDAAGRVASITDAAGETESYGYDAIGQRISLTNKLGHTWTYAYDAAGRLIEEVSPQVAVATSTVAGGVTTATRSVRTTLTYDALGNVTSRTEDAGQAQARTTQYQYDSRGHQIRTIFPDAWQVNSNGQLVATGQAPTIEVTYDALGQAVVQKDVRGNYSYKVYDNAGRVAYEVDPEGNVSGYKYNALGEQTELRRYATGLNIDGIAGFVAGNALGLSQMTGAVVVASAANDRILTTAYDRRGLKTQVTQSAITYVKADGSTASASPTTQFAYNAFGELARTSVLLDASTDQWAHSWLYYDELGRNTLSVDAEGYVTQTQYNALGEVVQVKEYARALSAAALAGLTVQAPPPPPAAGEAAIGYDRVVNYSYDAMGRKASESVLRHYGRADGSQGVRAVATQWTYDAAGQAIVTDVDGQQTRTTYDALGRVVAVQEAAQQRLANTAEAQLLGTTNIGLGTQSLYVQVSGYTALAYDAFGNAVRTIRYANGKVGESAPVADAANDQVSIVAYDRQGRAVMSQDAEGNKVYLQYDAADHIVHSWYALSAGSGADTTVHSYYTYDAAGRQLTSRTERSGEAAPDQLDVVRYNAFGEIVAKGNDLSNLPAEYQYDKAGNLVRSNAEGGAWRDYGYNLAGHQVRESHSVYVGPGNVTAVTWYTTDRLGRTTAMVLPSHTQDVGQLNYLSQKVDRWGNVIELVDPRGYQTTYQYNDRNQLVKEIRPLVKVVTPATPDNNWQRPELTWSYDEMGRLVASIDGNGNTTRYEYDGAGKQVKVIDANGSVTLTAYDALGRARMSQDALGHVTWKQYDRLDQVTAHGDYLPSANGSTRARKTLESYVLNQNGQRVQVANALDSISRYDYDSRGLLVRSQTAMGVVMEYGYDLGGRRSLERYALTHATLLDRDGETVRTNEQSWNYDYFGRLVDHNDLGGNDYDYSYDADSGQLTGETNSLGLARTMLYTANGLVREIQEPNGVVYRYEYDAAGNRTAEYAKVKDSRGKQYEVRTDITYDSHNRIQRVTQDDVIGSRRVFELSYDYDAAGNRTHVVASTGYGEDTLPIDAGNAAPTVIATPTSRTIRTGIATEFRVRLSDLFRDPEGKALSVTARQVVSGSETALPSWLTYSIDASTGEAVFQAGTGSSAADGQTLTLRLKASDGSATASVDMSLSVRSNTAPVNKAGAVSSYTVKTGRAWALELAASDYFTDEDVGDSLALTATVSPSAGWMTIDADNPAVLRLSAAAPVAGTYTVTLTATDQLGATRTRTVTLTVAANAAPTLVAAIPDQNAVIGRDFVLERTLAQVFTDSHGDPLALTATLPDGSALPGWLTFTYIQDQASPTLRWSGQPPAGTADGTVVQVKLTATDSDGASRSTTFSITLENNTAPAAAAPPVLPDARIGQAYSWQVPVSSLFSDPEGDVLSLALVHPQGVATTGWLKVTIDPATGMAIFSGTPTDEALQNQTYTVQLTATDEGGLSATLSLELRLRGNNPPVLNPGANVQTSHDAMLGRPFSYTLPDDLFTDADGDPISYIVTGYVPEGPSPGFGEPGTPESFPALPSWISYNSATRTLSGTVPASMGVVYTSVAIRALAGPQYNDTRWMLVINYVPFVNTPPVYNTGTLPNRTAKHGDAVSFALPAGAFTEPDGDGLTYSAQVQAGGSWVSLSQIGLGINASTGMITGTATNLTQASYSVRIIASDPQGGQGIGTFTLNVTNTPPTVGTIPGSSLARNQPGSFGVASYFSDVNQDALTYSATGLPAGLSVDASTGVIGGTPTAALGNYTVTVTANDGRGGSVSGSFTLTVANSVPTAPTIPNQTATAATSWSYTVPAFTDPNGDTLTYTVSGMPSWMAFNASTRVLSGTPGPAGAWTVTITATDPAGASVSKAFTVATPNVAPVVANTIGTQTLSRNNAWSYTVPASTFSDANGDTLTYTASGMPAGITFDATTRQFSGTPSTVGARTVTVTANDGQGGVVSTTFTFNVVNDPPVYAISLPNRTGLENAAVSWALPSGTFTDPNGDGLTYTLLVERPAYNENYDAGGGEIDVRTVPAAWVSPGIAGLGINAGSGAITGTLTAIYVPANIPANQYRYSYRVKIIASDGTASVEGIFSVNVNKAPVAPTVASSTVWINEAWSRTLPAFSDSDTLTYSVSGLPAGLSFNANTRVISGTPTTAGTRTVTYTANDGNGGVTSTTFTITVKSNSVPVAPTVGNKSGQKGVAWSATLPAFTDADNDALTYTATGLPPGISFAAGTRVLSGTPTTAGTYTVTYTANDGKGGVSSTTFTITVTSNSVPVAPTVGNKSGQKGVAWSATLPAFTDADNDALTYTATGLPPGMSFAAGTRVLSGTPTTAGTYTVTYTANDGKGGSASTTFTFTVTLPTNNAPYQNKVIPTVNVNYGGSVGYVVAEDVFLDPEGGALTYSATGMPSWLSFSPATRFFSGTPPQTLATRTYTIGVTATDAGGLSASTTFTISVKGSGPGGSGMAGAPLFVQGEELEGVDGLQAEPMAASTALTQDAWYAYDRLNRVSVSNGMLSGGQVVLKQGENSYSVSYDAVGNAVAQQRWITEGGSSTFVLRTTQQSYSLRGQVTLSLGDGYTTRYVYDDAGRLTERTSYFATGTRRTWIDAEGNMVPVNVGGMLASYEASIYDDDGRLLTQVSRSRNETLVELTPVGYPANPRQTLPTWVGQVYAGLVGSGPDQYTDVAVLTEVATVSYSGTGLGYDAAGRVQGYSYQSDGAGTASDYTHTYSYTYEGRDGYLEKTVTGTSSNSAYKVTTSTMTYDMAGHQTEIREHTEAASLDDRARSFAYDGNGMILSRRDGTLDGSTFEQTQTGTALLRLNQHYVYAAGQQVAGLDEAGKLDVLSRMTGFSSSDAGRAQVVVQAGETLRNLAQRVYGSADLWYVLAGANGLESDADLVAGTSLTVPEVRTSSNDASTFKPYNPGEITGPTSPGLPYIPPPDQGCGTVGLIIMVAVMVVVTVYTAGIASGAAGSIGAIMQGGMAALAPGAALSAGGAGIAFGAGAVGSFAGQVAGTISGNVDGVSLKDVLAGGLTTMAAASMAGAMGAASQGTGMLSKALQPTWARGAAAAVAGNLANVGANKLLDNNGSFSWKSVAASAVSGAIGASLAEANPIQNEAVRRFVDGAVGGMVSLHTRRAMGMGDDVRYDQIFADAFGNALASSMAGGPAAMDKLARDQQAMQSKLRGDMEAETESLMELNMGAIADGPMVTGFLADVFYEQADSFGGKYPYALASVGGGGHGMPIPEDIWRNATDGTAWTRAESDDQVALMEADIRALEAQGRDMTMARAELESYRTREYNVPTLDTVTVRPDPVDREAWLANQMPSKHDYEGYDPFGALLDEATAYNESNPAFYLAPPALRLRQPSEMEVQYYEQHGRAMPGMSDSRAAMEFAARQAQGLAAIDAMRNSPIAAAGSLAVRGVTGDQDVANGAAIQFEQAAGPLEALAGGQLGRSSAASRIRSASAGRLRNAGVVPNRTGTVWDSIQSSGAVHPGSVIPRQFELTLGSGQKIWVDGNATKHVAEYAAGKAGYATPEAVRLSSQVQLESLSAAVNTASTNGIVYRQMMKVDGWELIFAPPKSAEQFPALYHALYKAK